MITSKIIASGILKAVGVLAAIALGFYFLYLIQSVLIYLIISLILTLIGNPILDFFKRRLKFKHLYATIVTLLIFVLIIIGFIMMFVPLILAQGESLSLLNTTTIEKDISILVSQISTFLESHNIDSNKLFNQNEIISKFNFNYISDFINLFLNALSSFGMGLASVLFITFFFLKDRVLFIIGAKKLIPDSHEEQTLNSFNKINSLLSRYFIGLLLQLFKERC
jgi:predicted PurR-regulated permease PerM